MRLRLLFGITVAMLATAAIAQTPFTNTPTAVPEQRAALLAGLERGVAFTSGNQAYQIIPAARATHMAHGETAALALGRLGIAHTELLERRGDMLFYRDITATRAGAVLQSRDHATVFPVALNTSTRSLGFLPGTIRATVAHTGSAQSIAAAHDVKVYRWFPQLGIVYFQIKDGQDVLALASALAADAGVESAEPEVVEHLRVPR